MRSESRFCRVLPTPRVGFRVIFLCGIFGLLAGCSTVAPRNLESFSTGATAVRKQTALVLQGVNDLTNESVVDFAARQANLTDDSFLVLLDPEAVAAWDRALAALEKYAQALLLLSSPDLDKSYRAGAVDLARQIKVSGETLQVIRLPEDAAQGFAPVSAGVIELGDLLLKLQAGADVRRILRRADPTVRRILILMADAIDPGDRAGIRGTVYRHWNQRKGELTAKFLSAEDPAARRRLAREYAALMVQQRQQDQAFGSLRQSYLALADAHHALARGSQTDVIASLQLIERELAELQELNRKIKL